MASGTVVESPEVLSQSFAEFLESSPPNQPAHISDLIEEKWVGNFQRVCLKTPEIQLHCTEESCNGIRFYRCTHGKNITMDLSESTNCYLTYVCANCQINTKTYSIKAHRDNATFSGVMVKFGEHPTFGPPIPARLLKLIGPDRDNFLKGRRCENQGLGVGAFVYYRRVVEHQKNRIFKEVVKVSEKIGAPKEKIEILNAALLETQFTKALDMAKDSLPESLLINGYSPLKLLYRALSEGIHNLDDETCLGLASSVRIILGELSDRLSQALKDEVEITNAINRLLSPTKP
ncbi:hypothetical protein [Pseudomonas sp. stari2]|uniref:hypothetical protein n=1 Tax=Pseudomonas sp. Stari2 TaxID=2954814 RepID=UPI00345DB053